MDNVLYTQTLYAASFVGSIAFALSGFLIGARKRQDIMGIFILAFLTANGGGVLRDLLVSRPPIILSSTEPFWLTGAVIVLAGLLRLQRFENLERNWLFIMSDAVGLVAFGITGALIGIDAGVHFFGVLILSLLTATGGGIIRDLLVNEVPEILHGGFYGSVAILLGITVYVLHINGWTSPVSLLIVFVSALAIRLIAYRYNWQLPKLN